MVAFPPFRFMYHQNIFFGTQLIFHLFVLLIQFLPYFVINSVMLCDFVLTFRTCTIVPNFRTYSIYICINLTIVVIFIIIFIFVFI